MASHTILLAEDSPTMRFFITFSLRRIEGLKVIEASDGVEAMNTLKQKKIDLVILDVNMPLLGGLDVLKKMQQDPGLKDIPVVITTTEEKLRQQGKDLGASAFLSKPVRQDALHQVIKSLLKIG